MTSARRAVIVLMVLGAAALDTRQLESARGEAEGQGETATFAAGCFWCMEPPSDPAYDGVSSRWTGPTAAMPEASDPQAMTHPQQLDVFWRNIDPLMRNRQ